MATTKLEKLEDDFNQLILDEDFSTDPDKAWEVIKDKQTFDSVTPIDPLEIPMTPDKVRFVCMSDTHSKTDDLYHPVPDGDVFLHAGDFTRKGTLEEAQNFNEWLGTLPHRHKIVIAGNHEIVLDAEVALFMKPVCPKEILSNATYLCGDEISVYGIKIYGAPWTPIFHAMAFNLERGAPIRRKWSAIPDEVDILMTHGPPLGRGDLSWRQQRSGCVDLLHTVQSRVKPKYHVYGHIHEGYGMSSDGHTTYINASTCNVMYQPNHRPIVFDIPLPEGYTKEPNSPKEECNNTASLPWHIKLVNKVMSGIF